MTNSPISLFFRIAFALLFSPSILTAATVNAAFDSASTVPVTAAGYTAAGSTVDISLSFAPPVGTDLTVVRNTASSFIHGTFDNLEQGQIVRLAHGGVIYSFAANYFGGSGNDLVLQWANHRLAAWGRNSNGVLGTGDTTQSLVPVPVDATGLLAGKTILTASSGLDRSLALCSDGTLATWGTSRIGSAELSSSNVPVAVDQSGVLAGRTVIAVACGSSHSLALCSDGTLASWGFNNTGQLGIGNSTTTIGSVPVLVNQSGVLAGKDIIAIGAGTNFSVVLCSDGTLAAWGGNVFGQLGNNSTSTSTLPVLVDNSGVLASRTPVAIAVGTSHTLALCSDGSLVAWGLGSSGQLGNNSTTSSSLPVLTSTGTALAGKTVVSITAGGTSSYALASDNTLAAWGSNSEGRLGLGDTNNRSTPVVVPRTGVLSGKTITSIDGGSNFMRAHCSDGSVATWGGNSNGQLGNNSVNNSSIPVLTDTGILKAGEGFVGGYPGPTSLHNIALIASPPAAIATTMAATSVTDTGAALNGSVNPNLTNVTVAFEYGLTHAYGNLIAATPSALSGNTETTVNTTIGGLLPGTTYHFRVIATSAGGTSYGADHTFTTTTFATLSGLVLDSGLLGPVFSSNVEDYFAAVSHASDRIHVTPFATHPGSTILVNGGAVDSGTESGEIPLIVGANLISIVVNSEDGINSKTYTITVTRLPEVFRFDSASTVPATVGDLEATGLTAEFEIDFEPVPGTTLTAVKNTGTLPIRGTFANLAQGQVVSLTHAGISYDFAANYFGGSGNDLVLTWAHTRLLGWGINTGQQLGTGLPGSTNRLVPTPVDMSGVLAGKTVVEVASNLNNSVALCADGTLAMWGSVSAVPVLVDTGSVLAGKTPVAVTAGTNHYLVLCSDGTLAAWGLNDFGQLGNDTTTNSSVPVAVDQSGVLAGKVPVAITAGEWFSLVVCADGTLAAWGSNNHGRLGDGTNTQRRTPVLVNSQTALAGRKVVAIAASYQHSLALCSDGTLASWGNNFAGQLGDNSTTLSQVPVFVDMSGVLAGKTVVRIDAGQNHNLVLCSDGTLATWGENNGGQLGNNSTNNSSVPVTVVQSGVLNGKTVTSIVSGVRHNLALCSDATLVSWGGNTFGTLGDNSTTQRNAPVLVNSDILRAGERFSAAFSQNKSFHSFALAASLPPPTVTTLAASDIQPESAVLNATVNAADATTSATFEYGLTNAYGFTAPAVPRFITGSSTTSVSAAIDGLTPGDTYHFRIRGNSENGISLGADMIFTASNPPVFTGYTVSTPYEKAATVPVIKLLAKASDPDGDAISLTAAGPASANGGTITLGTGSMLYTPPAGFSGFDSFPVVITDSGGASTTGSVTVNVGTAPTAGDQTANPPKLTMLTEGGMEIRFQGIPGRSYQIQRSINLSSWSTIATVTANSIGGMVFIDESPPTPSAYYRLALP